MSDQEVIETLARREGWKPDKHLRGNHFYREHPLRDGWTSKSYRKFSEFGYLTSLDALRPVLGKFSEGQWRHLYRILADIYCGDDSFGASKSERLRHALTLPPETLARAIAEVLASTPPK